MGPDGADPAVRRPLPTVLVAGFAGFVTALDNSILMVALPTIGADLGLSTTGLQWIVVSYMLVFAGLLITAGALGDRFGSRRVLLVGLAAFAVTSLGCGTAGSGVALALWRAGQGAAAALLVPTGLALLRTDLHPRHRPVGIAVWTAALAAALAIGPALGGALSEFAHWRWIFLGAVPCCLVTLVLAAVTLRPGGLGGPGGPGTRTRLTVVGTTALSVAMFAFMALLLDTGPPVLVVVAVAASLVFVLHERRTAHPLLPRAVIGRRVFVVGALAQGLWSVAITGLLFVSPPYLERVLGLTPAGSGLFFVPIALAVVVGTPVVAPLVRRIGPWHVSGLGLALVAVALFAIVWLADRAHAGGLLACLALAGFGSALTTPLTTAVLDSVADRFAGVASGAITAARELAGALGVAAVGSTFAVTSASASYGEPQSEALAHAYRAGVLVAVLAVVVALVLTLSAARADKITRQPTGRAVRP